MLYKRYLSLTRKKISFFVLPLVVISLIFIVYQINIFLTLSQLNNVNMTRPILIRGTHAEQARLYRPNKLHNFICIRSLEEIPFRRINDNYCDCLDGSDEPGTNACDNGIFFCAIQIEFGNYPSSIFASKVNDGICDCCDGSDEWENNQVLIHFKESHQRKADRFHPPCPKLC